MDLATETLETKAGFAPGSQMQEAHVTHAEMMRTFDAYKAANDERLAAIERRGADVLHDEKVARIDRCATDEGSRSAYASASIKVSHSPRQTPHPASLREATLSHRGRG